MDEHLKTYLLNHLPKNDLWVMEMQKVAQENKVPIMDQLSIELLLQLIRIMKPDYILEIGTAIGYSALRMHLAYTKSQIVTIERDQHRYDQAIKYIEDQNKTESIKVIFGDAKDELKKLYENKVEFDFILIDAAKSQYKSFFELSDPLLKKGGIIISDNVLFKGYVAEENIKKDRFHKIAEKVRSYNKWLINHPQYVTTILPIGDGIAISYKK